MNKDEKQELLDDLYDVGKTKSLGNLPLEELVDFCGVSINEMIQYANKNELEYLVLQEGETSVATGAIYLYHEGMLKGLLKEYEVALQTAGVPTNSPLEYIRFIANNSISKKENPAAYVAIAKTYNDPRFRLSGTAELLFNLMDSLTEKQLTLNEMVGKLGANDPISFLTEEIKQVLLLIIKEYGGNEGHHAHVYSTDLFYNYEYYQRAYAKEELIDYIKSAIQHDWTGSI